MRFSRAAAVFLFSTSLAAALCAQSFVRPRQYSHDPLSPAEAEQVRQSTEIPENRVKLYMQFLDERSAKVSALNKAALAEHRGLKLHDAIESFAALSDEMQNNLDEYQDYESNGLRPVPDLRKLLPVLQKSVDVWQGVLSALPANGEYDFALETANDSLHTLKDQTAELIASQQKYFAVVKKQEKTQQKEAEKPYPLP
jgi:hypothetical protein